MGSSFGTEHGIGTEHDAKLGIDTERGAEHDTARVSTALDTDPRMDTEHDTKRGIVGASGIDTVLVDYDGTVMDTNELVIRSWIYAIKKLAGRDASYGEIREHFGEVITDTMPKLMPGVPVETAIQTYREYQRDRYLQDIRPFAGVAETLALLKARGYKIGMPSSRLAKTLLQGLDHFGLTPYFDEILTADDTEKFKPDPEPLLKILGRLGSAPERAVMIGDTKHDIEAAKAAGVVSVLVGWSEALPEEKRAREAKPDYVIGSWQEVPALLGANLR